MVGYLAGCYASNNNNLFKITNHTLILHINTFIYIENILLFYLIGNLNGKTNN